MLKKLFILKVKSNIYWVLLKNVGFYKCPKDGLKQKQQQLQE